MDAFAEVIFREETGMSRVKQTLDTINYIGNVMYGSAENPTLFLLPILSQIALSLAVIADKCTEEDTER